MTDEQKILWDLKEQFLDLSENCVTQDMLKEYVSNTDYVKQSEIVKFITSDSVDIKIQQSIKNVMDKIDSQDMSIYVTNNDYEKKVLEINNKFDSLESNISNLEDIKKDVYVKTEVDDRIRELTSGILNGYVDKQSISEYKFITIDDVDSLLKTKGYLTTHQPLTGYAKTQWVDELVTTKLSSEFKSLKDTYEEKVNELHQIYMNSVGERGFITKEVVDKSISESLVGYINSEDINKIIDDKGVVLKTFLSETLKKYTTLDWVKSNLITKDEIGNYIVNVEIPKNLSSFKNDVGYLTTHQSLKEYVKKTELDDYVKRDELPQSEEHDFSNFVVKDDISKFITSDFVYDNFLSKSERVDMSKYALLTDLSKYTKRTELPDVSGFVKKSELPRLDGFVTEAHLESLGYLTEKDLPDLSNYTKRDILNLYVKTIDFDNYKKIIDNREYISKDELYKYLNHYITKDDLRGLISQDMSGFATKTDILDFVTYDYLSKNVLMKSDKLNLVGYVKTTDLKDYVKVKELPVFDEFVKLPTLKSYVTLNHLESQGYLQQKDLPDLSKVVSSDTLKVYVTNKDFDDYKKQVESKGYITDKNIETYLEPYLKKSDVSDVVSEGYMTEDTVKKLISQSIGNLSIPTKTSELLNNSGFLTEHQSLKGYVKKEDILDFITLGEARKEFMSKGYTLPENVVYSEALNNYVSKSELNSSLSGMVNKNQLNSYVTNLVFETSLSDLKKNMSYTYVNKGTFEKRLSELEISTGHESVDLSKFITKDDIAGLKKIEENIGKYATVDYVNGNISDIKKSISSQKADIETRFIKKADIDKYLSAPSITFDESLLNGYYTKEEIYLHFLSKEDYRGIKRATTLNYEFNDYPDFFFELVNNREGIKMLDGFYVVDNKAVIVKNNTIIPVWDDNSPYWEIETDDTDWRDGILNEKAETE